jgi:hypothetical protein
MARPIEERDLRSLERRSIDSIFTPLHAEERLPRALILKPGGTKPSAGASCQERCGCRPWC